MTQRQRRFIWKSMAVLAGIVGYVGLLIWHEIVAVQMLAVGVCVALIYALSRLWLSEYKSLGEGDRFRDFIDGRQDDG